MVSQHKIAKNRLFFDNLGVITQEGYMETTQMIRFFFHLLFSMETKQMTSFFSSTCSVLHVCNIYFSEYENTQHFLVKATDSDAHHIFLENRHPEVTKNLYYVLSTCQSQITIFFRLQLMDYIGGSRKFHAEPVCFFYYSFGDKNSF